MAVLCFLLVASGNSPLSRRSHLPDLRTAPDDGLAHRTAISIFATSFATTARERARPRPAAVNHIHGGARCNEVWATSGRSCSRPW